MKYKYLGNTGIQVSQLCFGTMSFGGQADESTSRTMFNACRDRGINFFDCADVYAGGRSEEILGRCIEDCRQEVVITSKVWGRMGKDVNSKGLSRYHITQAVEASLRRLNTDRIDLYFVHRFDEHVPLEATLRCLDDLVRSGKVLHIGASNYAAWQVSKALGISDRQGWARFDCIQPMYNLAKRQAEVEIFPMAKSENLGVIIYSPLGGGLLTGKYSSTHRPDQGRLVQNKNYMTRYGADWMYQLADRFNDLASQEGVHPVSLAVTWTGAHPAVTAPIIGARSIEQLQPSLEATDVVMTADLWQRIADLSPEPPPATDRTEENQRLPFGER